MIGDEIGRRRLLAAVGAAVTPALAGCGYRPGGGELEWQTRAGRSVGFGPTERVWLEAESALVSVRNRSGRTFDFEADEWVEIDDARVTVYDSRGEEAWEGTTDRQYAGMPAVADGTVFVPLEDGTVAALARDDESDGGRTGSAGARTAWTTDRTGPTLALAAGDRLVACAHEAGLRCVDAADGTERFALERPVAVDPESGSSRSTRPKTRAPPPRLAVADGRVWTASSGADARLLGYAADGTELVDLALPATPDWIRAVGETCLVHVGDELWGVDPDADRRFALAVGRGASEPALVGDRCYLRANGEFVAVDVAAGERAWSSDGPAVSSRIVADEAGCYARTSGGRRRTDCDLVAVGADGEIRWRGATPDDPGCAGDLFLVGSRLVVLADGTLYGFRTAPADGITLL